MRGGKTHLICRYPDRETASRGAAKPHPLWLRNLAVPQPVRTLRMIPIIVVAALALLALITQAGVVAVQRLYPAQGQSIEVDGATLNVLDLGPRAGAGPP